MEQTQQTAPRLLVIYPGKKDDVWNNVYTLLDAETGEALASHFCTNYGYAMGDLYSQRPERIKIWKERFGEVEVKFIDETDISPEELQRRNKEWYEAEISKETSSNPSNTVDGNTGQH